MNSQINLLIQQAVNSFQLGDFNRTKALLTSALKIQPKNFDALQIMGVTLGIENQHNEALTFLLKAVKINPNNNLVNFNIAKALSETGKDSASIKFHQEAVRLAPQHPEAWLNFGKSLFQLQRYDEALTRFNQAIELKTDYAEAWSNKGLALHELKRYDEALTHHNQATQLKPDYAQAWANIGLALDELKRYDEAIVHYDQAIQLKPNYAEAWSNKGLTLHELKRYDEALDHHNRAIQLKPDYAEAWSNKGLALHELKRYDEALAHHDQAIQLKQDYAEAWSNKGHALHELKRYDEALSDFDHAIKLKPDYAKAWSNKALALHELQRHDEALAHYDQAIKLKPDYAEAWSNKGLALYELKRYDEALAHYDQAIKLKPDHVEALSNKALLNLFLKKFKDGFLLYRNRSLENHGLNLKFTNNKDNLPIWDGIKKCKNLLVVGEQGVGDQIFFSRLLSNLSYNFDSVTMIADDRLIPILARSFPKILFIGITKDIDTSIYDYKIPIGNLFHALNISHTDTQICDKPYLKDNTDQTQLIKDLPVFKNNLTCGLSWRSANPKHGQDKSISINDLKEIISVSNLEFVNLQYGDVSADANNMKNLLGKNLNCIDGIDNFSNIDGLLSIIKSCDVVVTASNVTAHLAGAIGKKTFLLLPYSRGRIWYWHDEKNSLWYPEIYQFYQDSNMSWQIATQQIAQELKGHKIARKN